MSDYIGAEYETYGNSGNEGFYGFYFNFGLPYSAVYQSMELYVTIAVACATFAIYCMVIWLLRKVLL